MRAGLALLALLASVVAASSPASAALLLRPDPCLGDVCFPWPLFEMAVVRGSMGGAAGDWDFGSVSATACLFRFLNSCIPNPIGGVG